MKSKLAAFFRSAGFETTRLRFPLVFLALAAKSAFAGGDSNWPHWRGPRDNGSTVGGSYPIKWDPTNVLWRLDLPGKGCSTPIVWGKKIFVTVPVEEEDALLAIDWHGKQLWQTKLGTEHSGKNVHGSGSNPSPVADGQNIFVYFKSGHFAALDFSGKIIWQTDLVERFGKDTLYWDYGTSPVLARDAVVVARLHHGDSYVAAFDKRDGSLRWRVARNYETPIEGDHSYATPLIVQQDDKEVLLVLGGEHLSAHDMADGKVIWSCANFNPQAKKNWVPVASPVVAGNLVVVPYGRGLALHGIKLGGKGDITETNRTWIRQDTGSFVSTPAEYKGRIYLLRDHGPERGRVECIDPATGKSLWSEELPKGSAEYYASPVVADGKLYAAREDGTVFVARIDPQFELLAQNEMGEQIIASPVPVNNRLLLRGERHLFCVGAD